MNCRVFLTAIAMFACAVSVSAGDVESDAAGSIEITPRTAAPDEQGRYLFLIRFQEPSIARYRGGIEGLAPTSPRATGRRKLDMSSPAVVAYREFLRARQGDYIARINAHTDRAVEVRAQVLNVLNAASMWLSLDEARAIQSLDFVRSVHIDEVDEQDTDAGPQWIGAPSFWNGDVPSAGERRGEGMVIGILDGGFIHGHESFAEEADDGYVHTNPLGTGNFLGDCELVGGVPQHPDAICNDKHIGSFTLHTGATTPEDDTGHGSHVASTAGGNPVEASLAGLNLDISGVAPRANLINFKVCLDGSCQSGARVEAVDLAIQHGADVINHSIGDSFPWTSAVGLAFLDAHDAGLFVSASAGNTGPGAGSIDRGAPWAGIIGNSSHNRGIGHGVDAAELTGLVGIPGTGPDILAEITGDVIDAAVADPGNGEGCDPFPAGTFQSAIALIPRGGCTFAIKVDNATDAGAVAVIVFNNLGGPPIVMGGLDDVATPAVMIDNEDGLAVQAALAGGAIPAGTIHAAFGIDHKDTWGDVVANLSARGPASFDVVKPDVTAPGTNILAAHTDGGFAMIGGTSMAAPHNAGAAALIMSEFPAWSPAEILSAIALTAQPDDVVKTDGVTPADPFDRGSGRVFLTEAARVGFVMDETVQNFEDANPLEGGDPRTLNIASMMNRECEETCTWERTITSVLPATQEYDATGIGSGGLTVAIDPVNFTLDPGESITLEITADVTGLPINEWFFGEVVIEAVAPADVAVARMPVVVMNPTEPEPPPPEAFIEVTPDAFGIALESGETVTEILTIGEIGGDLDLEWETVSGSLTLHDNGPLITHPGEGPGGSDHSVLQNSLGMTTLGINVSPQAGGDRFRVADDFAVPVAWEIDTLSFFGYQTGSTTTSSFTDVTYRIWDGVPDEPGSNVVFGDTVTNRLQSTGWTNAYRVSENTVGTTRPLMEVVAEGGFTLQPGTYWVDVQLDGDLASGPWMSPVTITGEDTTGDALRLIFDEDDEEEVWIDWVDTGSQTQQGMPFEIGGAADCWNPAEIGWLGVVPPSGTAAAGGSQDVDVVFDADGLAPGDYETTICIASNASNSTLVFVPVTLTVTAAASAPVAGISPESFAFEVLQGGTDGDVLNIGNTGDADLEWTFTDTAPAECAWDTTLGNPGAEELHALGEWGGSVYVGTRPSFVFNGVPGGLAEVDLDTAAVTPLGTASLVGGLVNNFVPYDDGGGERLFIIGSFNGMNFGGSELPDSGGVVAWDGSGMETLDGSPFADGLTFAQGAMVHDGQLVIGGSRGVPQLPVLSFWDGTDWTIFIDEFDGLVAPVVWVVEAFNGDLYFGGRFATIEYPEGNVVESLNIMGFDGENFFSVGGGLQRIGHPVSHVLGMKAFDDGSGEALYIGGTFDASVDTGEPMFSVAKWDGVELSAVGNGFPVGIQVRGFEAYDDGNGPALYAIGTFTEDTVGTPISRVARLEDGEWVEVAGGTGDSPVRILSLPDGSLGFAGSFTEVGGTSGVPGSGPSSGFARLACQVPVACDDISQIPWLDVNPDAGITAPGGNVPVDILVDAAGLPGGDYEALLCLATNDPAAAIVEIPVTMSVTALPGELEVSPASLDFGQVLVGGTGTAMVTVSNAAAEGSADLEITQIAVIAGGPEFEISGNDCAATLAPQTSCTVAVNYSPGAAVPHTGFLRIDAEGKDAVNVTLSGNGIDPEPTIFEDRFEEQ